MRPKHRKDPAEAPIEPMRHKMGKRKGEDNQDQIQMERQERAALDHEDASEHILVDELGEQDAGGRLEGYRQGQHPIEENIHAPPEALALAAKTKMERDAAQKVL